MTISITDGTGSGSNAAVTENNRLKTTGIDLTLTEAATESGDTYNINTATLSLSSSGESGLLYIKNNEESDLHLTSIVINIINFTGTDGQPILKILRNPDNGTLISAATAGLQLNRNFGSSKSLDIDIFQGSEGATLTGQDATITIPLPSTIAVTLIDFTTLTILPKGSAFGLTYTPPPGITSVDIAAAVTATLNGSQL